MDKSPNSRPKPADISQQEIGNKPLSGERPGQGDALTNDHYDSGGKPDADKRLMPAPDTLGAKHTFPILAQPPETFTGLRLEKPADVAAGIMAVIKSGAFAWGEGGIGRGTLGLLKMNQKDGPAVALLHAPGH